ncbi:hypothetical protein EJB05_27386, partial [Eragrostis curvula]
MPIRPCTPGPRHSTPSPTDPTTPIPRNSCKPHAPAATCPKAETCIATRENDRGARETFAPHLPARLAPFPIPPCPVTTDPNIASIQAEGTGRLLPFRHPRRAPLPPRLDHRHPKPTGLSSSPKPLRLPPADARAPASTPPTMAGEDPYATADDDDPCPLCGGPAPGPAAARVTLAKRRLFPADATTAELEAERAAAADAASEAMSMILRLQRDKSEAMMEARQYRRYAEERFAHDAAEADALRAAVGRRDAAVGALSARLRECQARLLHLGFPSPTAPVVGTTVVSLPSSPTFSGGRAAALLDRPFAADDDEGDEDHYHSDSGHCLVDHPTPDVGTPRTHHLLNRMPDQHPSDEPLPRASPCHARTLSYDSVSYDCDNIALADEYPLYAMDRTAPDQDDDRVYTVDAVHGVPMPSWAKDEEVEIQKLKARLHALEADRESMRHAIMSMGDEKAQVVLLREIAQQLCKEGAGFPPVRMKVQPCPQPVVAEQRKVAKRQPCFVKVFIVTVIKWFMSIICWRKKSNSIKYPIGLCGSNVGLMLVLDRYPKQRRRKFLKRS